MEVQRGGTVELPNEDARSTRPGWGRAITRNQGTANLDPDIPESVDPGSHRCSSRHPPNNSPLDQPPR